MLDGAGKVRIMDFGLAVGRRGDGHPRRHAGLHGARAARAASEVTVKSDIYALGLVLYELFTGRRAFDAKTLDELVEQHESGPIRRPPT